jgi:KDO2-lipid IV(A) lauroyltransferase
MAGRWKGFRHRLELFGVHFLSFLPRLLPYRTAVRAGTVIGIIAFDIVRIRRRVTLANLEAAFGDRMSEAERVRTGRLSYINFAKSMIEFASIPRLSERRLRELVTFEGEEYVQRGLEKGTGAVMVTGHFGSWELLGAAAAAEGMPVDFLVGEQTNPLVDDYINGLRKSAGIGTIPMGVTMRGVFKSLKDNRMVAMLSDQDARKAGIFVDFLGIPASTYPGAAQFAFRLGSPVIFCYITRNSDETHRAAFLPPMEADREGDKHEEIRRLTEQFTSALERAVREFPGQYFWAHRRWKTAPPESPHRRKP